MWGERPRIQSEAEPAVDLGKEEGGPGQAQGDPEKRQFSGKEEETIEATAITLANADLNKAMDWLAQLQDPDLQRRATLAVGNEAVRSNPIAALNLAGGLSPCPQRDDLIRRGVSEWALADALKAKEWAAQIEDESLRAGAMACIATSWSDASPVAAANLALDELPDGRLKSDTLVSILQRWAQSNPQDAAAWVEQFPEGALKAAAEKNLLAVWSVRDAAEAGRWKAFLATRRSH
jgi:hypothetical protein